MEVQQTWGRTPEQRQELAEKARAWTGTPREFPVAHGISQSFVGRLLQLASSPSRPATRDLRPEVIARYQAGEGSQRQVADAMTGSVSSSHESTQSQGGSHDAHAAASPCGQTRVAAPPHPAHGQVIGSFRASSVIFPRPASTVPSTRPRSAVVEPKSYSWVNTVPARSTAPAFAAIDFGFGPQ